MYRSNPCINLQSTSIFASTTVGNVKDFRLKVQNTSILTNTSIIRPTTNFSAILQLGTLWMLTLKYLLKGIVHRFWIHNIFLVPLQKKFCKRSISIKQLWLEIMEIIECSQSVRSITVLYINYYIYNTDWLSSPFFSPISSQSYFIEMKLS